MKIESQICTTREQSERLLALGLKRDTADMHITNMSSKGINYTDDWQIGSIPYCNAISIWNSQGLQLEKTAWSIIPAWSLHRLIVLSGMCIIETTTDNFYDKVIQYIAFLIKCESFNKKYLEE